MSHLDRITSDPAVLGGRPCIRGLRVRVKDILDLLASGASRADILADYPYLEDADIAAALEYAAQYVDHPVIRSAQAVRFLIDAQLPPALARHLVVRGHEAEHLADIGMLTASDALIWQRAVDSNAVLITKDEDFVTVRALSKQGGPPIVWVRLGNTTRRALIARFDAALPSILEAIERGETVVQISDE